MNPVVRVLLCALICVPYIAGCVTAGQPEPELVAFLVRHAEKEGGPDPALTAAGKVRAAALSELLRDDGIDAVLSSDFRRTRETAQPVATVLNKDIEIYDPYDLLDLAEQLRDRGGRVLVVGHSNTTPELARLLGGEPGAPIDEATEYDRLYVVTVFEDGRVETELRRYGNED